MSMELCGEETDQQLSILLCFHSKNISIQSILKSKDPDVEHRTFKIKLKFSIIFIICVQLLT